jgi:hypothetical protein
VKKEVLRAASKLFLDRMIVEDDLREEEEEDLSFICETLQSPNFVCRIGVSK